jgi:tetratricopeptide (TPR) repeat protein
MVHVFLSHSSKDKPFVRELADALETGGDIKVWLDEREINYGDNAVLKMEEGLDADVVLLILSPDSVESKWVKEEWTDAFWDQTNSERIRLAPVLYRDCRIPHFLRNKKPFDLTTNQTEGFRQIRTWLLGLRSAPPPIIHLPQRPPLFIERGPELEDLRNRLREPGSVTYISGLAGRGKTTLALMYAHRHQREYESVHWLPCQSRTLVQVAGELTWQLGLKLEGDLDTIVRELNGYCVRKRCLLVFDNVEDDAPARLFPGGRTSVLITTRLTAPRFLRGHRPLNLPLFTEEQCFDLFDRELGKEEVERHKDDARSLFRRLEYLPIAIAVTASLIREDVRYTIAEMAKSLPADATALLRQAVSSLNSNVRTLLVAMAVCAPEGFRLSLAAEIAELDEASSLGALQEIHSHSLAEELDRTGRRYRLHALVREAAGATDAQRHKHAESVLNEFEGWEQNWRQCEKDLADWQIAFTWALEQTGNAAWVFARQLAYPGYQLTHRLGRLPEAHEINERIAREAERRSDKPALQAAYGNQAVLLQFWGRLEEAMELHKNQEALCHELNNQDGLMRSYGNQAAILKFSGRFEEAMELLEKQEALCNELGNKDGLQVSFGNQALILHDWGRLEEAMELLKKQEAICEELGSKESLQRSYGNQALILRDWSRLEEAMELLKKAEALCLELGSARDLAFCYWKWGLLARKQKDRQTEKQKLEKALALFTELRMPHKVEEVRAELDETNRNAQPN